MKPTSLISANSSEANVKSSILSSLMLKAFLIVYVLLGLFSAAFSFSDELDNMPERKQIKQAGQKVVADLLLRSDYMMYLTDDFKGIHYAEAAVAYGALKFSQAVKDEAALKALSKRYQVVPGTDKLLEAGHVDANVYGILPIQLHLSLQQPEKLTEGLVLADAQWQKPREDGMTGQTRYWIDDIWMVNSLQLQAYRASGKQIYLDRAALQTEAYLKKLQQTNGLFFHGPEAHFHWGRGNGWVAAGLAELLQDLPQSHARYRNISEAYFRMMEALLTYQAEDGMWRQLIDKPESWKESSATAMFAYAMQVGVKRGILPALEYSAAVSKAWDALNTYLTDAGRLREVCVGTGQSQDIQYYLQRPRTEGDFHGQAPFLWLATALLEN